MPHAIRWGILAPGGIAEAQTKDLLAAGHTVTAVGSRSVDRARSFADRFGIPTAHGSYEELVTDPDVDAVYVASPHSEHYPHARLALEAGKHVLVEKAFTVTGDQAAALVELAESRGLVVLEAMWARFLPHMVRVREIIAAGTIGEVRTVLADHNQRLPSDPTHRLNDPSLAGGALLDLGIYPVSFAWDMLGAPTTIQAHASFTKTGVDRQTAIVFGYADGQHAVLHTALDTLGPTRAAVLGTDGWISLEPAFYEPGPFTVYGADGSEIERVDIPVSGRGMQYQAAELERLVDLGVSSGDMLPAAQSVAIMRSLDEIRHQIGLEYPADILSL